MRKIHKALKNVHCNLYGPNIENIPWVWILGKFTSQFLRSKLQ